MDQYELAMGRGLDDEIKVALLVSRVPSNLRDYLEVSAGQFEGDYDRMKNVVQQFLQVRRGRDEQETGASDTAIEVDYIQKGCKGSSTGKGKGKHMLDHGKATCDGQGKCFHCGRVGPIRKGLSR